MVMSYRGTCVYISFYGYGESVLGREEMLQNKVRKNEKIVNYLHSKNWKYKNLI